MMKATEKAGFVNKKYKKIFFDLELETPSYYCAKELPVDNDLFNYPYIICDLGEKQKI